MAYNRTQAQKLLTAAEYELFEASLAETLAALNAAQLKSSITRTRRLRDKQRDLHQRQRLASRDASGNKSGKSGVANARTAQKAQALDEALARFEKRAAAMEKRATAEARRDAARRAAAARKAAQSTKAGKGAARGLRRAPGKSAAKPKREVSAKATRTPPKDGPDLPAKKRQMGKQRTRANLGRVSAAGRRSQGKRDSR
jgi:hypothetical protein